MRIQHPPINWPIRVTFDSNVWRLIVSPDTFPHDPEIRDCHIVREAISSGTISAYLTEPMFTLEALQKKERKAFFGSYHPKQHTSIDEAEGRAVRASFCIGPNPDQHANMNAHLAKHWCDALALGFRILRCPRIGGITNPELMPEWFAVDDRFSIGERQERFGACAREIETRGGGISHVKTIGGRYDGGRPWMDGLQKAPSSEREMIAKAVAEWADGDSVAAHYGYGNDYFCTRDVAKGAGVTSVFSPTNRAWLAKTYNIAFISPVELANMTGSSERKTKDPEHKTPSLP